MTSQHKITDIVNTYPQGDVDHYFEHIDNMLQENDGDNNFTILSSDSYSTSAPIKQDQYTKFKITDTSMDIVDISKGYLALNVEIGLNIDYKDLDTDQNNLKDDTAVNSVNILPFFVGFKSGAQIINVYNVYSNGRLTACKNTKAKHEQALVYSCKAKEERCGRPGMYSPHKEVLNMTECICGTYIYLPASMKNATKSINLEILIQVDDLLPFSAMSYYPRFLFGDLELELSANLVNNMVFCPIPVENVLNAQPMAETAGLMNIFGKFGTGQGNAVLQDPAKITSELIYRSKACTDSRFHQCGDWAKCLLPLGTSNDVTDAAHADSYSVTEGYITFRPNKLEIKSAKSYVHGFRIKDHAKENLRARYADRKMKIPAQWIEHYTFSQQPAQSEIRTNIQVPMFNVSQAILTFPNSAYQTTVSRNPHLSGIQAHIGDRILPDKFMTTLEKAHSEMILTGLGMDSLFSAPPEVIESLTRDRKKNKNWTIKYKDDSDYMLVLTLERYGAGCFCDGMNGINIPINFHANYINGKENPHYFELDVDGSTYADRGTDLTKLDGLKFPLRQNNVNLHLVSDCFWIFGPNGGEFIKDLQVNSLEDIE